MSDFEASESLKHLVEQAGLLTSYIDLTGEVQHASIRSLVAAINALGIPYTGIGSEPEALDSMQVSGASNRLPPVIVAWDGQLRVEGIKSLLLRPESGGELVEWRSGQTDSIAPGYYHVVQPNSPDASETLVISAPTRCYKPAGDKKRLGLFTPFYALSSKASWGCGDFGDARELIRWAGKRGIDIVGTLPLSAQFLTDPCEPSPYQPASRLFWNELYIDLRRLPEYRASNNVHRLAATARMEKERKALVAERFVDYRQVAALKRKLLQLLADEVFDGSHPERLASLREFLKANPDVEEYARFMAGQSTGIEGLFDDAIRYFTYTQWIALEQLRELVAESEAQNVGLYLDLPLGSHPSGYDLWKYRDHFVAGFSIGAPPDPLGPEGQVWGIPPVNPLISRRSGHSYFRSVIKRHTSIAGLLRIDHVMGLHRLYWVPDGLPGSEGVYMSYPADELWAIISLESHLNHCEIVGEDLGTVPDEVRQAMDRHGVLRLYVLPFEVDPSRSPALKPPPWNSIASLNTHDLVPFAGYWQETDIDDRKRMGWLDDAGEKQSRWERSRFRDVLKSEAEHLGVWDESETDETTAAIRAGHRILAASDASIVLVNIEDLWAETVPQNRPGTVEPIPNWRKKLAKSCEEIVSDAVLAKELKCLVNVREKGDSMAGTKRGEVIATEKTKKRTTKTDAPTPIEITTSPGETRPLFLMTQDDCYLFNEGSHLTLYEKLGAHPMEVEGIPGVHFAVWAPDAASVHVVGDFNGWNREMHPLYSNNSSGVWEGFIPGVVDKATYKYFVKSRFNGFQCEKADPFAFHAENAPRTGSKVWETSYQWNDAEWMSKRAAVNRLDAPISIYELHLGSWRRVVEQGERSLSYRELAEQLPPYCKELGFTHVQFLPVMEHPFYGSWGYQTTGYFAPTSRFGTPQDFMHLIDVLHQNGIGVILDWVPSHFPADEHGLAYFDGTHLYEHADHKQGFHPDWGSLIFNYGRNEVRSFLFSSGIFWLDKYHADGLRVDAVASMLYLDYSRKEGEWIPNQFGGRENLEAISFLRRFNEEAYHRFPDIQLIAEESTSWPAVSRPTYLGGLGFGMKWDMGWMHDTLDYFSRDPIHRRYHHNALTFRMLYAWHENFMLPLSHDEVVHGKGSLIGKMPGDTWQKFANLRLLYTTQFTQPGKKLLFMGAELGQWAEWNHDRSLDWHLLQYHNHSGLKLLVQSLNELYRKESALFEMDCEASGFEWVDCNDADGSTISYLRWNRDRSECILVVLNFTPVTHFEYRVGVPTGGRWMELFNSDSELFSGSGKGNLGQVFSTGEGFHGRPESIFITLPPLAGVILKSG